MRLKQDPQREGVRMASREIRIVAAEYGLLALVAQVAGSLLEFDVPVGDKETQATADRILSTVIASTAEIMRHELQRRGGSKDSSWPGLHHGHA